MSGSGRQETGIREHAGMHLAKPQPLASVSALLLVAAVACTTVPRDPEKTLQRVQTQHRMRVGVVESPPWVVRTAGQPGGVEPGLVRQFAASIRATPEWFRGGEQQHMEALERFELDLVIGGLDARTPWKKRIAFTSPYFEEQIAVGVPKATQEPAGLNGLKVKVLEGDVTAAYLLKQHGIALRVPTLSNPTMPVAAPVWRLQQMGLIPTHLRLFEKEHVIAVPPGENGWLKALGDFLQSHRSAVQSLLATSEAQP